MRAVITPEHADIIREEYRRGNRGAIHRAQSRTGLTAHRISKYASRMGFSARHYVWTAEEDAVLAENADQVMSVIQSKLKPLGHKKGRSVNAIAVRMAAFGIARRHSYDDMRATEVAELMGIHQQAVYRWIHKGWLKATKENYRKGTDDPFHYRITRRDLKKFMVDNVHAWSNTLGNTDPFWLVDILTGR